MVVLQKPADRFLHSMGSIAVDQERTPGRETPKQRGNIPSSGAPEWNRRDTTTVRGKRLRMGLLAGVAHEGDEVNLVPLREVPKHVVRLDLRPSVWGKGNNLGQQQ